MSVWLYWIIVFAGIVMFALRNLRANIWWVAFFSAAIYDLPISFGVDHWHLPLPDVVIVHSLAVLGGLLLICASTQPCKFEEVEVRPADVTLIRSAVAVCVVSFLILIAKYGTSIFFAHKTESGISGSFYIVWRLSATYAIVLSVLAKNVRLTLISAVPMLGTLFAGDRTAAGLTLVAVLWALLQSGQLKKRSVGMLIAASSVFGVFLFFGKTFQGLWWSGTYISLGATVRLLLDKGSDAITQTEPFATMGVFSAITTLQHSPPGSLFVDIAAQFLIVPSFFGFDSSSFNDFFQTQLFPSVRDRSLAYSFWGEAYVRGGSLGILAFFAAFALSLRYFDRLTQRRSLAFRSFAYIGGSYLAFYIHRNSMVSMIAYERQIILFGIAVYAASLLARSVRRWRAP